MPRRQVGVLAVAVLLAFFPHPSPLRAASKSDLARQIRFGAEMARQGNWREAIFRWQRALALEPANPRLHNNLAVAFESLGDYDKAEAEYRAALALAGAPDEIKENHELFLRFYTHYKENASSPEGESPRPADGAAPPKTDPPAKEPGAQAP